MLHFGCPPVVPVRVQDKVFVVIKISIITPYFQHSTKENIVGRCISNYPLGVYSMGTQRNDKE